MTTRQGSRAGRRRVALAVIAGAAMLAAHVPAAPAAPAEREVLASVKDPRGDMRIHHRSRGLTRAERTSIDLRSVTVEARGSVTRFTVRLRDVRRTRGWDQMVFMRITPSAGSDEEFSGSIGLSAQDPALSYAYIDFGRDGEDFESCDPLRLKVSRRRDHVRLDVPRRCLPEEEAVVRVQSMTGYFRSDAGRPWSSDRVRFPGTIRLR